MLFLNHRVEIGVGELISANYLIYSGYVKVYRYLEK